MDGRVEWAFGRDDAVQLALVANVRLVEADLPARDFLHTPQRLARRVAEVVHNDNLMPCGKQFHARMATDEPGAARHKNFHLSHSLQLLTNYLLAYKYQWKQQQQLVKTTLGVRAQPRPVS